MNQSLPIISDAIRYDGSNAPEVISFAGGRLEKRGGKTDSLYILDPADPMKFIDVIQTGDWVVRLGQGTYMFLRDVMFREYPGNEQYL